MKKLFFVASLALLSSGLFANSTSVVNGESTFDAVLGSCHIVITDNQTGEVVYEATLPANTAEDCKKMLAATLAAMK